MVPRMKNLLFVAAISLSVFGCKKGGGSADCDAAINHSMDLAKDDMKKMGTDDKMVAKLVDIGKQRCKEDKWGNDALKCMVDAKDEKAAQGCYDKLTKDQQEKMNKAAMEAAMANAPKGDMAGSAAPAGDMAGSAAPAAGSAAPAAGSAMAGSADGSAAK